LVGYAVKPVGNHLSRYDGRCLADEDEKGGLEGILGIVLVAQNTAADAPHHRSMSAHQGCNSGFVTAAEVVLQQLPIGQPSPITHKHGPAKVLDDLAHLAGRHLILLPR
jgi:hypothetical protein